MITNDKIEEARSQQDKFEKLLYKHNPKTAKSIKKTNTFVIRGKVIDFWDSLSEKDKKKHKTKTLAQLLKLMREMKKEKEITVEVHDDTKVTKFKTKIKNLFK